MKSISRWICTNSSKNLFVKIVHQGGRVELYDRPITAADVLQRNTKCCVAHPTVFNRPHDVVSPTTALALGQKYYVVPITTVKKLQLKYSKASQMTRKNDNGDACKKMEAMNCWLVKNNNSKKNVRNGGRSIVSLTSCDQWQPGLESIREE